MLKGDGFERKIDRKLFEEACPELVDYPKIDVIRKTNIRPSVLFEFANCIEQRQTSYIKIEHESLDRDLVEGE